VLLEVKAHIDIVTLCHNMRGSSMPVDTAELVRQASAMSCDVAKNDSPKRQELVACRAT